MAGLDDLSSPFQPNPTCSSSHGARPSTRFARYPPPPPTLTGDKPELAYPEAAAELAAMGYSSTLEYVEAAAAAVMAQTGLLPHVNAGVVTYEEALR